jgi:hypothetical protein
MWWVEEEPWLPVLFVVGNQFFWMYVKREKWSGPFATDLLGEPDGT